MPFDRTYQNPRIIGTLLTVRQGGKNLSINLDSCLGATNGKFYWGGREGFSAARNTSLSGSDLFGELKHNGQWLNDQIDLSTNIQVRGGKLVYVSRTRTPSRPRSPASSVGIRPVTPPVVHSNLSVSYDASFAQEYRTFTKSSRRKTYSERSSSYFKFSVGDTLHLESSVLHAESRRAGEQGRVRSQLDLDPCIGIVNGKLVWGRQGFFSACRNVRLEGFVLHVECEDDSRKLVTSSLDLSRYLYVYGGTLGVKVDADMTDLSGFFSEAPWLKFKVVTETDSNAVLGAVGEGAAFKSAFSALAETTSNHVVNEVSQEFYQSAEEYLKDAMNNEVKTQLTTVVANTISTKVREEITSKVQEAFRVAQEAVLTACNEMVDTAANDVAVNYTESVVGPMQDRIIKACNAHMQTTLAEVSTSAIAQFQERAEIMMERELVKTSVRRAQTHAHLLKMIAATLEGQHEHSL